MHRNEMFRRADNEWLAILEAGRGRELSSFTRLTGRVFAHTAGRSLLGTRLADRNGHAHSVRCSSGILSDVHGIAIAGYARSANTVGVFSRRSDLKFRWSALAKKRTDDVRSGGSVGRDELSVVALANWSATRTIEESIHTAHGRHAYRVSRDERGQRANRRSEGRGLQRRARRDKRDNEWRSASRVVRRGHDENTVRGSKQHSSISYHSRTTVFRLPL